MQGFYRPSALYQEYISQPSEKGPGATEERRAEIAEWCSLLGATGAKGIFLSAAKGKLPIGMEDDEFPLVKFYNERRVGASSRVVRVRMLFFASFFFWRGTWGSTDNCFTHQPPPHTPPPPPPAEGVL